MEIMVQKDNRLKPLAVAIIAIHELQPVIFAQLSKGLIQLCKNVNGGAQGNALTPISFGIISRYIYHKLLNLGKL